MKVIDKYILIAQSAGRCNYPDCDEILFHTYKDQTSIRLLDFCHIIGKRSKGPRGRPTLSELNAENPENIILLCKKHHVIVDNNEKEYPVEDLRQMKEQHIRKIIERLSGLKEANWTLLIHTGNINNTTNQTIDEELIVREFYGTYFFSNIEHIEIPEFLVDTSNWLLYKKKQEEWWSNYQTKRDIPKKFVICSINFIPLVIHIGYLLHDTNSVEIYQFDRFNNSWKWKKFHHSKKKEIFFSIENDGKQDINVKKFALAFSISGDIQDSDISEILGKDINIIKVKVRQPDRTWLKYKEQLIAFQNLYVQLLDGLISHHKNLKEIHIFFAGPTPIAFKIGTSINPNMHPKFVLYNYNTNTNPKYTRVFELN